MKNLSEILQGITYTAIGQPADVMISGIAFDSRKVTNGTLFFAIRGTLTDGHQYIAKAVEAGATAIVSEEQPVLSDNNVVSILVDDAQKALAMAACNWFEHPSAKLRLVGITGTNGKTTTATLLFNLFESLGYRCGLLSTVENRIHSVQRQATHTTPDPIQINALLAEMVEAGCDYAFMEVSSHSVVQHRISGLKFAGGVFTNLTHDHLDYHKTFAEYLKAKKGFFDQLGSQAFALVNTDDRNGTVMLQNCKASHNTYALKKMADYHARVVENLLDGLLLEIDGNEVWFRLVGQFNAYNLTAVYATALLLDQNKQQVLEKLSAMQPVEGRFDTIRSASGITAIVDYAHTPDALQNVLNTINQARGEQSRLITVAGAGGDRDKTKRPEMARIAAENSDRLILTSDNPRTENPTTILSEMAAGLTQALAQTTLIIENRREAIRTAVALATKGDIVLIAGKGHEKYQEINGVKHHFDDKEEIKNALGIKE